MGSQPCRKLAFSLRSPSWWPSMPWRRFRKSEMMTQHRVLQHLWMRMTAQSTTTSVKELAWAVALHSFQPVVPSHCPQEEVDLATSLKKTTTFNSCSFIHIINRNHVSSSLGRLYRILMNSQ